MNIMTKLIKEWSTTNDDDKLKLLMSMPNLLLQRTTKKSKARENKDHLIRRLELWENEEYENLLKEGQTIQQRLDSPINSQTKEEDLVKAFRNHMIRGNVNAALRLLNKANCKGVLPLTPETIAQLHEKHPPAERINDEMILKGPINEINPIIFMTLTPS